MNQLLKNLGVIIVLIGVVLLAIPYFTGQPNNTFLGAGLVVMIVGYMSHILLNKKIEE